MADLITSEAEIPQAEATRMPSLHRILITVFCLWAVCDVGGRLGPVHWLHVLPEHEATRRPGRTHPFIPNLSVVYAPWVGESALTANLAPTETRPPVHFSTDANGYRLTPGFDASRDVDLILYSGHSFAYGGGLSDEETLPAELSRAGLNTYNGGNFWWTPEKPQALETLVDRFPRGRRSVIMLCWEDAEFFPQKATNVPWRIDGAGSRLLGERYWQLKEAYKHAQLYSSALFSISPLEVLSIRFFKSLSNGTIFPNLYASSVEARTAPGVGRFLFLDSEVRRTMTPPGDDIVRRHGEYFELFARKLAARGVDCYVVLLPNRYTLYAPLLDGLRIPDAGGYLARLEDDLKRRHIAAINTYPMFRSHAAEELAQGQLSFYREDHHWTPLGVRRVAGALLGYFAEHPAAGIKPHAF